MGCLSGNSENQCSVNLTSGGRPTYVAGCDLRLLRFDRPGEFSSQPFGIPSVRSVERWIKVG